MPNAKKSKVRLEKGTPDSSFVSRLARIKPAIARDLLEAVRKEELLRSEIERSLESGGRSNYIQISAPYELHALTRALINTPPGYALKYNL